MFVSQCHWFIGFFLIYCQTWWQGRGVTMNGDIHIESLHSLNWSNPHSSKKILSGPTADAIGLVRWCVRAQPIRNSLHQSPLPPHPRHRFWNGAAPSHYPLLCVSEDNLKCHSFLHPSQLPATNPTLVPTPFLITYGQDATRRMKLSAGTCTSSTESNNNNNKKNILLLSQIPFWIVIIILYTAVAERWACLGTTHLFCILN